MSDDRKRKIEIDADKKDALLALLRYARDELESVDMAAQYFVDRAILHLSEDAQDNMAPVGPYDAILTVQ